MQVGVASLVGVGITVLLIPINMVIASKNGKLSTKMMAAKDERVRVMAELLSGSIFYPPDKSFQICLKLKPKAPVDE